MKTTTALQFHEQLAKAATPKPEIRRHDRMTVGQVGHQGDVYVHRIDTWPCVTKGPGVLAGWDRRVLGRQVALGATVGSRHIADGDGITVYWPEDRAKALAGCPIKRFAQRMGGDRIAAQCLGPVIVAEQEWTLTHPEHAHHVFPAGVYLTTYQLDRRTMQVVRD